MAETDALVLRSARAILAQVEEMIAGIDEEAYRTPGAQGASIGQHTRHTLDHYRMLVNGYCDSAVIAYDRRDRGGAIETERAAALTEIGLLSKALDGLDETQLEFPVRIRVMVDGAGDEAEMDSTLVREMWFVTHHAIHHNALIRAIAGERGLDLPEGFGRAPSTVNHEQTTGR